MSWTAPRTWTDGEITTAAIHNAHIRDNLSVVKVTRADSGKLIDLSSTTLADLSPASLSGLATRTAGSAYTAGRTRFQSTARLVLPVGTDKYQDLGGGLRRGAWVEGDYIHHIASNQTTEYRYLGESVDTPAGADSGSVWVEGDYLHYIDESGNDRRCKSLVTSPTPHTDAGALGGSSWVETYLHWVRESGSLEKPGHWDVAHSDGTVHNDTAHVDTAHVDAHTDVPHNDVAHGDVTHVDSSHGDHGDGPGHFDVAHGDVAHGDGPTHGDVLHGDTAHSDTAHVDSPHSDHSDHGDVIHVDQPTVVP